MSDFSIGEGAMGTKAEALAKQFESKAQEATAALEKLSDADWKKVTEEEKWTVGVTAHHMAGAHEPISNIVRTIASGQSMPNFTMDMLHAANAKHAKDSASCTREETIALHKKGVAAAAAVVRGLSDDQLGKSGVVLTGAPPMSAEQVVTNILINHINGHLDSIRKTIRA
jgi:hypothetical protein